MKINLIILSSCLLLIACKKTTFEDDECKFRCHILSGYLYEYGTTNPISNAEVLITADKRKNTKYIVSTTTDASGYWKMSFDADHITNLKEGHIQFEKKSYFKKRQRIYFDIDSMNIEQKYVHEMHETAEIFYQLNISNADIKRIESRFVFEGEGFKELKYTNKEVPAELSFRQTIPASQDVYLSLWTSLEENSSGANEWLKLPGFYGTVNVAAHQADTIMVELK